MVDYYKRLVEVDEILNYLSEEDLKHIPEDIRDAIKENKDKEYTWEYDETKALKDQDVSRDTIAILSYLNMEYLLNDEQKRIMEEIHELNEKKQEQEKREIFNPDNIFKKSIENINIETKTEEIGLIEYKENIFLKIKKFIFKLLNIKKR